MAAEKKMAVAALLIIAMLVLAATPAVSSPGCIQDCVSRCSNGKNLVACGTMCAAACVKSDSDASKVDVNDPYLG